MRSRFRRRSSSVFLTPVRSANDKRQRKFVISAPLSLAFSAFRRPIRSVDLNVFGVRRWTRRRRMNGKTPSTQDIRRFAGSSCALNSVSAKLKPPAHSANGAKRGPSRRNPTVEFFTSRFSETVDGLRAGSSSFGSTVFLFSAL